MPWKLTADPMRFDEAIEELRKRVPMTRDEWDQLESRARARAFTVAGVAQLDVINDTKKSLVDALELGKTFHEWKKDGAQERLENAWQGSVANPAARLETIYRTNLQTQYSRGHELQASHPAIQRHRPYKRFVAAIDDDTTDVCREADGTILPADHPWWDSHTPPLHFNCRSTVETLSTEEAEELGITESPTELTAQEGFGEKPQTDPDPALEKWAAEKLEKVDAELAEIYRAKEEARVQAEERARKEAEAREREEAEARAREKEKAEEQRTATAQAPILSEREYQEEAQKRWKDWEPNLTQAEQRAVQDYTDTAYLDLNRALRLRNTVSHEEQRRAVELADRLDKALAKSPPLQEPITVFRGSDYYARLFDAVGADLQLLRGEIVDDSGFMSTSASQQVAAGFGKVVAEIRLPAGARVGFLEPASMFPGELEVLLPRGTALRIIDAWVDADGTKRLLMEPVK